VLTAFLVDAIGYQYFYFLYKTLWVLLIPLTWNIFFYCLERFVTLQKLIVTIFFDIKVIEDASEDETSYEFQPKEVPEEVLSRYPFLQTEEDYNTLIEHYKLFDAVEGDFIKIFESSGPIPQVSTEYNLAMILVHVLSLSLWSYMSLMTILTNWL
jgi:hypothetical protein